MEISSVSSGCMQLKPKLVVRDLAPSLWPALETLFGPRGACGGCWCMYWRLEKGERWEDLKGAAGEAADEGNSSLRARRGARSHLRARSRSAGSPIGPRQDFPRLDRARTLACDDPERVWSLPCFFIKAGWRDRGVASALLRHSLRSLRRQGAKIAEGYPVNLKSGQRLPHAFAWTGTRSLFADAGFELAGAATTSKVRMRRKP